MRSSVQSGRLRGRQAGFILPLIVILSLVLALTGMAVLSLSVKAQTRTTLNVQTLAARSAADAGLAEALYRMNRQLATGQTPFQLPLTQRPLSDLAGTEAQYQYTITGDWISGYQVDSQGQCGSAVHTVHSVVRPRSLFEYAVFASEGIELKNGSEVRVFNNESLEPLLLVGTNSSQSGAIDLKNNVLIDGDVAVGPDAAPEDVVKLKNSAKIKGEVFPLDAEQETPLPTVPDSLQSAPYLGTIDSNRTLQSDARCREVDLAHNEKLRIDGDVSLYVDGDIELRNSAEVEILPGSSLTIYLDGDLTCRNSGTLNNRTQDAGALEIYGLAGCEDIELRNNTTVYAAIYAPHADVVSYNSASVIGSVIARSFTQHNAANFLYDVSLRESQSTEFGIDFRITRWWED